MEDVSFSSNKIYRMRCKGKEGEGRRDEGGGKEGRRGRKKGRREEGIKEGKTASEHH